MHKSVWFFSFCSLLIICVAAYQTRTQNYSLASGSVVEIEPVKTEVLSMQIQEKEELPKNPILKDDVILPEVSAQSVLVEDLNSGTILFEKSADLPLLPASTTKIITAMVSLEYYPLDAILTVGKINIAGQKMKLVEGERISVMNLLYGLLVYSANDAAEVLSENYLGGREGFIQAMNRKITELGLTSSRFTSPSGLDMDDQYTTSRDLIKITKSAMNNNYFKDIVNTKSIEVKSEDGIYVHKLTNINTLLGRVDGVMGVKTGWTENARENLVTYVKRNDHGVMIALLGSNDRFGETTEVIEWVYSNYLWPDSTQVESITQK